MFSFAEGPHTITANVPPADTVSDITIHPSFDVFAATAWDNSICFYDFALDNKKTTKFSAPLLCGQFYDGSKIVAGSATGTLFINDFNTNQINEIKAHEKGIKNCKLYNNIVLTASWDHTIKFWDLRSNQPVFTLNLESKIYSMDIQGDHVAAALANNQIVYFNVKELSSKKILKTKFKYQLRSIRCSSDKVFVGGIEGAIETITYDNTPDILLKIHRVGNMVYTVNCIDVNPINNSIIASGGSDGSLILYNKPQRYKVHSSKENSPITACRFTRDGNFLIYAIGEDWSKGYPSSKTDTKICKLDLKKARVSL